MNWKLPALVLFSASAVVAACSKNESGSVPVQILLTDAPAAYDQVNVDIRQVRVNLKDDSTGWRTLATNAGVYDLLTLQNGITDTLAYGDIPDGTVKEIRFILGPNNTIRVNGQLQPLTIPSGGESGLKIKLNKNLNESLNTFVLDFDAALSIKQENDGYKLRPVIKLK